MLGPKMDLPPGTTRDDVQRIFEKELAGRYEVRPSKVYKRLFVVKKTPWTGVGVWVKGKERRNHLRITGTIPTRSRMAVLWLLALLGGITFLVLWVPLWYKRLKPFQIEMVQAYQSWQQPGAGPRPVREHAPPVSKAQPSVDRGPTPTRRGRCPSCSSVFTYPAGAPPKACPRCGFERGARPRPPSGTPATADETGDQAF